ncbi:MAG: 2OG-Fe(II) oxygenase [Pseudomonadota bacterium]
MKNILDLDRFPLDRPDSTEWQTLVAQCRADLAQHGMFNLAGLMKTPSAQGVVSELAGRFADEAFLHERRHNIYFRKLDNLPDDHPAMQEFQTSNRTLCADQISGSALLRLYEWPYFAQFLAATMGKPQLHVMDDPLARVNVMSYQQGQALNWHFDRSEFTTTLLLQAPDDGGEFEYRTDLRTDTDPNYDGVAQLLRGADSASRTITLRPGTLNVFKGKNTAHRVTPVIGTTPRVIAVFSFYEQPGVTFSEQERIGFYGRA